MRALLLTVLATMAASFAACGGSDAPSPAPGSKANPLVGHQQEATATASAASSTSASRDGRKGAVTTPGRSNEAAAGSPAKRGSGSESAGPEQPGYQSLLARQSKRPRSRFTPCNLVTVTQAEAILRSPMQAPIEAPQGPTCIYRTRSGNAFVTVALQKLSGDHAERQLQHRQRVRLSGHSGVCGRLGQDLLYVPLQGRLTLTIAAPCPVARQFAVRALAQL